ncbi:hypothetical protein [Ruegeria atlantica]|nr:hypothetical protein [Ruegeria atlantica]
MSFQNGWGAGGEKGRPGFVFSMAQITAKALSEIGPDCTIP